MEYRTLGATGLSVSRLGLGLAYIGDTPLATHAETDALIGRAVDSGINFFDTAECYGNSEVLLGHALKGRRHQVVVATKCGHRTGEDVGQHWTAETVRRSIDRSLWRLRTDYIDLIQIHSADLATLQRGELILAMGEARRAGKVRFLGYSGDNAAAAWVVKAGLFAILQTSFNLVDQNARTQLFPDVQERGMGLIIKRPLTNGAWWWQSCTNAYYADYFRRAQEMKAAGPIVGAPEDPVDTAFAFAFSHDEPDSAIVGTSKLSHLEDNLRRLETLERLRNDALKECYARFERLSEPTRQLT